MDDRTAWQDDASPSERQPTLTATLDSMAVQLQPRPSAASPTRRLSLDSGLQHQIKEGSPPHRDLAAPPLFTDGRSSSPRGEVPPFLRSLANALQRCVDANQAAAEMISPAGAGPAAVRRKLTPFHGVRAPPISIAAYLERIAKYAKCSPVCFVMAATYLERLAEEDGRLRPSALNVHRLLVTGVLLAAKLMDDHYFNNAYYAKIGGVALEELNALELHMMQLLDHRLRVSALTVTQALQRITSAVDASPHDFSCLFGSLLPPVPEAGLAAPDSAGATVRQQRRQQEQQNSGAESCMAPQPVVSPVSIGIQAF